MQLNKQMQFERKINLGNWTSIHLSEKHQAALETLLGEGTGTKEVILQQDNSNTTISYRVKKVELEEYKFIVTIKAADIAQASQVMAAYSEAEGGVFDEHDHEIEHEFVDWDNYEEPNLSDPLGWT